jgi:hypothetical protein
MQAQFDAAVERLSGPAAGALLVHRPGAPPAIDAGKLLVIAMAALFAKAGCMDGWAWALQHFCRGVPRSFLRGCIT